jgi:hypothetical protein
MKKHFLFTAALFAALSLGFVSCENPDDDKLGNSIEQSDDDKLGNSTEQSDDNETPDAPDSGDDDSDTPSAGIGTFSVASDKKVTFSKGICSITQQIINGVLQRIKPIILVKQMRISLLLITVG